MAHRGKSLKALRESKQIQLRRIANETRINISYLEDLEEERFDRFPGEFYFHSFAKSYAESLGLDSGEVTADLKAAYEHWRGIATSEDGLLQPPVEDGLLHRIAGFIRRTQEV